MYRPKELVPISLLYFISTLTAPPPSCYGLLIPYYDSTIYGRVIFQCLIPPILNVCGVYFLAQFSLPKFEHTFNHKLAYGATVFLSIGIKIVAVFGVGSEVRMCQPSSITSLTLG